MSTETQEMSACTELYNSVVMWDVFLAQGPGRPEHEGECGSDGGTGGRQRMWKEHNCPADTEVL